MNYSFATSQEAADIVGITPSDIGVPANHYVRKKDLIATGKFDESSLSAYADKEFVLLKDIEKGSFMITLTLNSDVADRGTVQIGSGTPGATVSAEVNAGDEIIAKCNMTKSGDVFIGWFKGDERVSTNASYSFTATQEVSLVAKIAYIDVNPTSISFGADGGTKSLTIKSNVSTWTVS